MWDSGFENEFYRQGISRLSISDQISVMHGWFQTWYNIHLKEENTKDREKAEEFRRVACHIWKENDLEHACDLYAQSAAFSESQTTLLSAYRLRRSLFAQIRLKKEFMIETVRAYKLALPLNILQHLPELKQSYLQLYTKAEEENRRKFGLQDNIDHIPSNEVIKQQPYIQNASACIKIKTDVMFGRHVVASKRINIGDILIVEEAVATALFEDDRSHCYECLNLCYNLIPCASCPIAMYCSDRCKFEALVYHKYECAVLRRLKQYQLAREMVLTIKLAILMRDPPATVTGGSYYSSRKKKIYDIMNLCEHLARTHDVKLCNWLFDAVNVYHILKNYTDFFDVPERKATEDRFKEIIIKIRAVVHWNYITIFEFVQDKKSRVYSSVEIGYGLFPVVSLFNHSCCPNAVSVHYGSTTVVRALRTINRGEQCYISYGPQYYLDPIAKRANFLDSRYHFRCECNACLKGWPVCEAEHLRCLRDIDLSLPKCSRRLLACEIEEAKADLNLNLKNLKQLEDMNDIPSIRFCFNTLLVQYSLSAFGSTRPVLTSPLDSPEPSQTSFTS